MTWNIPQKYLDQTKRIIELEAEIKTLRSREREPVLELVRDYFLEVPGAEEKLYELVSDYVIATGRQG